MRTDQAAASEWGSSRRVVDLGLVLASAAVAVVTLLGEYPSVAAASPVWLTADIAVAVLAPLSLLARHRFPVAVALGLLIVQAATLTAGVALVVVLFSVALHQPPRVALPVVAAVIPVGIVHLLLRSSMPFWLGLALFAMAAGAGLAAAYALRIRRELVASLQVRAQRAEADQARRAVEVRRAERTRIAREMHDALGHRISLIGMHAGALAFRPDASTEAITRSAEIIRSGARAAMIDLREIIGVLRADGLTDAADPAAERQPSLADLPELLAQARTAGDWIAADLAPELPEVSETVGRAAYRLVQEGLTNARRHAPGAPVHLDVTVDDAQLTLTVRNPVCPGALPSRDGGGTGLVGLVERIGLAGGRVEHGVRPAPDGEYVLRAWLPCGP